MRRLISILAFALLASPGSAIAAHRTASSGQATKWQSFKSAQLHFSLRMPRDWRLIGANSLARPISRQITFMSSQAPASINVSMLSFAASPTVAATLQHFVSYEQTTTRSSVYTRARWSATSLGGQAAYVGVIRAQTEGGTGISDAIYLTQWRGVPYEIVLFASHKPTLSQLRQFPPVYFQILSTWRFL